MDNLTPQDKIDEIYRILHRQESRRKMGLWYVWTKRILIYGFIVFTVLYPGKVYQMVSGFLGPIIKTQVSQLLDEKKENTINSVNESIQKLKDSISGKPKIDY